MSHQKTNILRKVKRCFIFIKCCQKPDSKLKLITAYSSETALGSLKQLHWYQQTRLSKSVGVAQSLGVALADKAYQLHSRQRQPQHFLRTFHRRRSSGQKFVFKGIVVSQSSYSNAMLSSLYYVYKTQNRLTHSLITEYQEPLDGSQ